MHNWFYHIRLLVKRILIVLFLFTVCRLVFFIANYTFFSVNGWKNILLSFLHGVRFDISAILYINLIYIFLSIIAAFVNTNSLYNKIQEIIFYLFNGLGLLLNLIDAGYYRFQKKRTTFELFSGENDVWVHLPEYLMSYWYLLLTLLMLITLMIVLYKRTIPMRENKVMAPFAMKTIAYLFFMGLIVLGLRGGLQTKPIQMITASAYGNPSNASLVLNTPFTIFQSLGKKTLEQKNYFDETEQNKIFDIKRTYVSKYPFIKKNVVIIILESFSNEWIGSLSGKKTYSPFIDSLISQSLLFDHALANGKKSNEAMPSIFASIPSLMDEAYSGSIYQDNHLHALPGILKEQGYYTTFFHGGPNGTMNFDVFAKKAGFDEYYGLNEYPFDTDYDGNWGVYDEPFFQFFAKKLNAAPKPFLGTFFSLSSHPPYSIPQQYQQLFSSLETDKLKSFRYTDLAMKKFFDYVKTQSWYYNTLFVITADHSPDTNDPFYSNSVGMYRIPLILFDPSNKMKGRSKQVAQQIDIMPTILDYLNYPQSFNAFGESLLREKKFKFSVNYQDGVYQIIDSAYILQLSNDETRALYNYKNDSLLRNNVIYDNPMLKEQLEKKVKAFIQKFNQTLIKNNYEKP